MNKLSLGVGQGAPSLFVCVGDVSADRHTAAVIARLKTFVPNLVVWGVGGPEMERQGVELLANCQQFATIGIIEPIRLLPFFAKLREQIKTEIVKRAPNTALLVDFGGFNIGLAQQLRPRFPQLPIIYFISPQVWGSRPWRINVLKRCITKMLTIFPFEEVIYGKQGVDASFVGHPLTLTLKPVNAVNARQEFCQKYDCNFNQPIIGIFPGSRVREISTLLPIILPAIYWLNRLYPNLQFVISRANQFVAEKLDLVLVKSKYQHLLNSCLKLLPVGENASLMAAADILWTKSGTTTLEAALFAKPMLIFYRGNWLSYWIFLLFKQVKHVGWPNLLSGETIVPELIQLDCRPELLVKYTSAWLDVPAARQAIIERLNQVRSQLGAGNFAYNAASEILKVLQIDLKTKNRC